MLFRFRLACHTTGQLPMSTTWLYCIKATIEAMVTENYSILNRYLQPAMLAMIKNMVVFVFEPKILGHYTVAYLFSVFWCLISSLCFLHNLMKIKYAIAVSVELLIHFYVTYFVESLFAVTALNQLGYCICTSFAIC